MSCGRNFLVVEWLSGCSRSSEDAVGLLVVSGYPAYVFRQMVDWELSFR